MLQNWFILLPEILLISYLVVSRFVESYRANKTARTFATLSQIFVLGVIICSVVFYNKSVFPKLWQNTSFTTLLKCLSYLIAFIWFYLSSKWFLNKNRPSYKFYSLCFGLLLALNFVASASSFAVLFISVLIVYILYYKLILWHWDYEKVKTVSALYLINGAFFILMLIGGILIIYNQCLSLNYEAVRTYYATAANINIYSFIAVAMILSCFLFLLALAPFHLWYVNFIANGVLPVCGFISLVPPLMYLCGLVNLIRLCFPAFSDFIIPMLNIFGFISLFVGVMSANYEVDIRKLFSFLAVYAMGFVLASINDLSNDSIIFLIIFMLSFLSSLLGVYTVFLGFKSKSEYLSNFSEIAGFSHLRPYMSAAMLIFVFSFMGLAPTIGFFADLPLIDELVSKSDWLRITALFIGMIFALNACLHIIRNIWFQSSINKFDRADKAIFVCLLLNVIFIFTILLNPDALVGRLLYVVGEIK